MTQTAKKSPFSMNVDLMHGPIFKNLLLFMLPIFISNLFQQLYNTVDTMIVGNVLGDTALAAIGSCGSIYELLVGFGLGIGNGLAIVAARSYGAQDHDLLKKTVAGSLVIGLAASLCITLAGVLGLHPLLLMLDTPAEILDDAYRYILTIDLGVLVMFAYNLCAGLLRAIGNSVMPLVFLLISSGLNVVLDLLFIARMGMGVQGAAVATVISQGVSVVLCILYIFLRVKILLPEKQHFRVGSHLLGCAHGNHLAAACTAFGAHVDDPVGSLDHVQVVLNHHDGVALIAQLVEHIKQLLNIRKMQAGGRLIQNVQRLTGSTFGQLARQLHALRFTAGQRCR